MKDNHKYLKRFLAFALSVAMVITYMPVNLIAYAETEAPEQPVAEEVVNDTASTEAPAPQEEVKTEEPAPVQEEVTETEPAPVEEPAVTEESSPAEGEQQQAEQPEEVVEETSAEETSKMPAKTFTDAAGGIDVTVVAPEGTFPAGTIMKVTPVSQTEVIDAVQSAMDSDIIKVKAVDITFFKDGAEVQPLKPVKVTMSASGLDSSKDHSAVHVADNGNVDVVADVAGAEATFKADSFSVYAIIEEGEESHVEKFVRTYEFYNSKADAQAGTDPAQVQHVKDGETLYEVAIPKLEANSEFKGWKLLSDDSDLQFGTVSVTKTETIKVYPDIQVTYYVTYIGGAGEIMAVEKISAQQGQAADAHPVNYTATPSESNKGFFGWSEKESGATKADAVATPYKVTGNKTLYPIILDAYWITFNENDGGTGGGASYTGPRAVVAGDKASTVKPTDPTRAGYTFGGWYTSADCTTAFDWDNTLSANTTVYAKWNANPSTSYTIILWKQKVSDSKDAANSAKTYDYEDSKVKTAATNADIVQSMYSEYTSKSFDGFHLRTTDPVVYDEKTIANGNKVRAKGDTVINVYFDRNLNTIEYYTYNRGWNLTNTMTGLYGQTLAKNGYTWDTTHDWYENGYSGGGTGGTHTTFLDSFKSADTTERLYGKSVEGGQYYIRHYKQNIDNDNYPSTATNETRSDGSGTWNFTEKYEGFTVKYYSDRNHNMSEIKAGDSKSYSGNLYVYYTRNKSTLTFKSDGKVLSDLTKTGIPYEKALTSYEPKDYVIGKTTTTIDNEPYIFTGWFDNEGGQGNPVNFSNEKMPAANKVLYAGWQKQKFSVHLDPNGGTLTEGQIADFAVDYGTILDRESLGKTTRDGYTLVGWFDKEGNAYGYGKVTENTSLTAKWRRNGEVSVVYEMAHSAGDEIVDSFKYATDSTVVVARAPEKVDEGYSFIGWQINGTGKIYYPNNSIDLDKIGLEGNELKLVAKYDHIGDPDGPTEKTSITFDPNGGKGDPVVVGDLLKNEKITADDKGFTRDGYEFVGWALTANKDNYKSGNYDVDFATGTEVAADNLHRDKDGNVTDADNYNPKTNILYAVWKPLVKVEITGKSDTKVYNGSEQSVTGYDVVYYLGGKEQTSAPEGVTVALAEGKKAEAKGTNVGDYPMGLTTDSFVLTSTKYGKEATPVVVTDGKLTITPVTDELTVTVTGNSDTKVYNKQTQSVEGFTSDAPESVTVALKEGKTAIASGVNAGEYPMGLTSADFTATSDNYSNIKIVVVDGKLTITPITEETEVTVTGNTLTTTYNGNEQTVTGFTTNAATVDSTITVALADGEKAEAKGTDADTYPMGLTAESFTATSVNYSNIKLTVTDGWLKINPISDKVTVKITGNHNTNQYDGAEHTTTGYEVTSIDNTLYSKDNISFTGKAEAKRTDEGKTMMNLTKEQFSDTSVNFANVVFEVIDGYQEITPVDEVVVTIKGKTGTKVFNGSEQSVEGYDVEISNPLYKEADFTFSGTKVAKGTNVGTYPMGLKEDQFTNNNKNFAKVTFKITDGSLTITKAQAVVTITGNKASKEYNGSEQQVEGYKVSIDNSLYKEADFTFSGTKVAKGTDVAKYPMGLKVDQFTNNNTNFDVTFNVTDGELEITPVAAEVVVKIAGKTDSKVYDATEHKVTGYDVTDISNKLYKEADFTFSGKAEAAQTEVGKAQMGLSEKQFSNKNANFSKVTFEVTDGYQEVTPAKVTVTITGHHNTTVYDGKEHKVTGYDVEISNPLYKEADFTFSGEAEAARTEVGKDDMGLKADQFKNNNKNFEVTFNVTDGYQEITPVTDEVVVTIKGDKKTDVFDGKAHTATGYTFESSNALYKQTDVEFTGTASASRTDVGTTSMGLKENQFRNISKNFSNVKFNVTDGSQEITPLDVTVTITGKNNTTEYDGTEHKVTGYDEKYSSDLYTAKDYSFSGKAEAARTDAGQTDMGLKEEQFKNTNENFNVTFVVTDGYQRITPVEETVVVKIKGNTNTTDYDGTAHKTEGYKVAEISNKLYTEADIAFSGKAEAERTDAGKTDMGLKQNQFSNTNNNFKEVVFDVTDGYQEIKPINVTVTITGHNNTTVYDGKEHKVTGYDVQISNKLYKEADFSFSGKAEAAQTEVGKADMGLKADQFKNNNKNFAEVTFNVTDGYQEVTPVDEVVVTITGHKNTSDYDGKEHSVTGYDVEINNPLYKEADFSFSGKAEAKRTDAGKTDMGLKADQFKNNNKNFAKVTFNVTDGYQEITPINVTVDITGKTNTTEYDGKEHKVSGYDVEISNPLYKEADFEFSGKAEAARTEEGKSVMNLTADQFKNTNANFAEVTFNVTDGYQEITPVADEVVVTITGHNNSTDYDAKEHSVEGYDVEISNKLYTEADFAFDGEAKAARTDAGKTDMGLEQSQFTNISKNFAKVRFVVTDGYQEIKPIKAVVTITGHNDTAEYDGKEHVVRGYDVSIDNELYKASDFTFSGNAEAKRTEVGKTDMGLDAAQFSNTNKNFSEVTFNVTDGYQEITPFADKVVVTITGHKDSADYDGKEHAVSGYDVKISNELYTEDDFTFSGKAEVKGTDVKRDGEKVGTYPMGLKNSDFENISKNFADVEFVVEDGSLEIKPIDVTIVSASDSKTYDGTPLTKHAVTVDGFVEGEGLAAVKVTGTQTYVGSSENTFEYKLFGDSIFRKLLAALDIEDTDAYDPAANGVNKTTKADNYNITATPGTLTVTDENVDIDDVATKTHEDKEYKLGETVKFTIEVTNIYDAKKTITVEEQEGVTITSESEFKDVEPGAKVTVTAEYVVTEADLLAGSFSNTATVKFSDVDKPYEPKDEVDVEDPKSHLTVDKKTTSKPANGETYALGETITYEVTATNDGNMTLKNIEVTDELTGDAWTVEELAPGEFKTFTAEYTVTEKDIIAGSVKNEATATAEPKDPEAPKPEIVPGTTEDPTDESNPHLTVVKETTSTPANGKEYEVGETVTYEITVTNDGNLTVKDIEVKDDLTGDKWNVESLAPEQSQTFNCEYTITEEDAKNGSVTNIATATGITDDPNHPYPTVVPGEKTVPVVEPADDTKKGVKTGDDNNFGGWLAMMLLAGAGASGLFIRRRREDEE